MNKAIFLVSDIFEGPAALGKAEQTKETCGKLKKPEDH
jgi:hypothetical protein